jgi:hypothetical protein
VGAGRRAPVCRFPVRKFVLGLVVAFTQRRSSSDVAASVSRRVAKSLASRDWTAPVRVADTSLNWSHIWWSEVLLLDTSVRIVKCGGMFALAMSRRYLDSVRLRFCHCR